MELTEDIESILYIAREISVHKIPPLKANEGHRAAEWGDLAAPLWKGRLRIVQKSQGVSILFEDNQTGELFAQTPYDPARPSVEAVLDSSRYFVVRIEDAGRKAYIGLGFVERSDSFDFNVALQDYTKRWRHMMNPPTEDQPSPHVPAGPKKDYSLKEGQTFSISIPGRNKPTNSGTLFLGGESTSFSASGSIPLLPPPPSSKRRG
ncbi:hypothetical protein AX16_004754 [Volvariella volvacea WC 439]|nr:hypothetical protein AX16_004754 [Volvariella volvacea WC 439]